MPTLSKPMNSLSQVFTSYYYYRIAFTAPIEDMRGLFIETEKNDLVDLNRGVPKNFDGECMIPYKSIWVR